MRMRSALVVIAATVMLGAESGNATDRRLRIEVSPRVSQAPAEVRIRAIVTPSAENRALKVVADSGDYFRSSYISLDGADSASVTVTSFKNLPTGQYEISVTLIDADGEQEVDRRTLMVTGAIR
jgi:methionine-rich copper-binding protein CopC